MESHRLPRRDLRHRALLAATVLLALIVAACGKGGASY